MGLRPQTEQRAPPQDSSVPGTRRPSLMPHDCRIPLPALRILFGQQPIEGHRQRRAHSRLLEISCTAADRVRGLVFPRSYQPQELQPRESGAGVARRRSPRGSVSADSSAVSAASDRCRCLVHLLVMLSRILECSTGFSGMPAPPLNLYSEIRQRDAKRTRHGRTTTIVMSSCRFDRG